MKFKKQKYNCSAMSGALVNVRLEALKAVSTKSGSFGM
jgi:hypothetical protein